MVARGARGVRRARRRGGGRPALPPQRAAGLARGAAVRRDGGAQWPSRLNSELRLEPSLEEARELARGQRRARSAPASSTTARRRSRPSSSCAPASPRGRPASCSSRPSRARSAATRSSASARARCCAGATGCSSEYRAARIARRPTPTRPSPSTSPASGSAPVEGLPPFAGGAVGFFGYDLVRTVEPLGEPNPDPLGLPDMALMVTDVLLVFDHLRHELTIIACAFADDEGGIDAAYERAAATIAEVREPAARRRARVPERPAVAEPPRFASNMEREEFEAAVAADRRVRPRRRRLPGRALAALLGARPRSRPSRSTAACARSTPPPTCTSSSSATSRSPAPRRSRWSRCTGAGSRRGRSPAPTRAAATRRRTAASPSGSSTTPRSGPST